MSKYIIQFNKSAVKDIKKLPKNIIQRVLSKIFSLAENPHPSGCRKMQVQKICGALELAITGYFILLKMIFYSLKLLK